MPISNDEDFEEPTFLELYPEAAEGYSDAYDSACEAYLLAVESCIKYELDKTEENFDAMEINQSAFMMILHDLVGGNHHLQPPQIGELIDEGHYIKEAKKISGR